jgi:hypothetical protein
VEGRLTVYSQVQRRNVTKEQFRKDLKELMEEYKSYTQPLPASKQAPSQVLLTPPVVAPPRTAPAPVAPATPATSAPCASPVAPATALTTTVTQPATEKHG